LHSNAVVNPAWPSALNSECRVRITLRGLSNAAHNATNNQQQSYVTMQASTTQGVSTLLSVNDATTGVVTSDILRRGLI